MLSKRNDGKHVILLPNFRQDLRPSCCFACREQAKRLLGLVCVDTFCYQATQFQMSSQPTSGHCDLFFFICFVLAEAFPTCKIRECDPELSFPTSPPIQTPAETFQSTASHSRHVHGLTLISGSAASLALVSASGFGTQSYVTFR